MYSWVTSCVSSVRVRDKITCFRKILMDVCVQFVLFGVVLVEGNKYYT